MAAQLQFNQPLPPNPYNVHAEPEWHSAYASCLQLQPPPGELKKQRMQARSLGYMIIEAPTAEGRNYICHDIVRCGGDSVKLCSLADRYVLHFLRVFKKFKGSTPAPSDHPSRPSFEEERYFFASTVDPAPRDHSSAKRAALARDNYSCMVTGYYDASQFKKLDDAAKATLYMDPAMQLVETNACHIFPPSTDKDLDPEKEKHPKTEYSSTVWAVINGFGGISVLNELNGPDIHRLSNILTLRVEVHSLFDKLDLWFELVPNTLNTYNICVSHDFFRRTLPPTITFTSHNGFPLPDPRYLKLHAAACRIAHLSGATEYIETHYRDMDSIKVLACDGTSAEILSFALQGIQVC